MKGLASPNAVTIVHLGARVGESSLEGSQVVTCRYLGESRAQQGKDLISTILRCCRPRTGTWLVSQWAGRHGRSSSLSRLLRSSNSKKAKRLEATKQRDPEDMGARQLPGGTQGLVCKHAIKAFDGGLPWTHSEQIDAMDLRWTAHRQLSHEAYYAGLCFRASEPHPRDGDVTRGRLRRFVRFLTNHESPPADAHLLLANRRWHIGIREASALVGVRVTPQTYAHLSEYASLMDIHEAEQRATSGTAADRTKASEHAMSSHPELWAFYQRAKMGLA